MTTVKARYEKLAAYREPYLRRAQTCASLTLPYLYPPTGATGSTNLPTPYQSVGAEGVNNLSSKMILALLPPNSPFFRLAPASKIQMPEEALSAVEEALSKLEREVMDETERLIFRPALNEAAKHLVVAGNVLLNLRDEGLKVYHLDRYVVRRDALGTPLEILVMESVAPSTLTPEVLAFCRIDSATIEKDEDINLYTHAQRRGPDGDWYVEQELNGYAVPESEGVYPADACPWLALRWAKIDGEDYGRGYVEEYLGDLISCEELSKAIVQGAAAAAKVVFLVEPSGMTNVKTITKAENLDVVAGRASDVSVLQMQKFADFQVALTELERLEGRLRRVFLLNSSIQRKGERVTAEEIRYMAGELEDALGGIYSLLTQELQLPLVQCLMAQMRKQKRLPSLPKNSVKLTIIAGLEALGRNHDLEKLRVFLEYLSPLGPEVIARYVSVDEYVTRIATAIGITAKGLVRSSEEIAQEEKQSTMLGLATQMAPEMVKVMAAQGASSPDQNQE
jgi:hypothetical protein